MKRLLSYKNICVIAFVAFIFLVLQVTLYLHTASTKTRTLEYLGRGVFAESQPGTEYDFYGKGKDRWNVVIPPFNETFRMHTASFDWNPNTHIPPESGIDRSDVWVGTCTLTPKFPWRYIDVLGILGPVECSVYGDWHVESE